VDIFHFNNFFKNNLRDSKMVLLVHILKFYELFFPDDFIFIFYSSFLMRGITRLAALTYVNFPLVKN
jgi:hypothetical protein